MRKGLFTAIILAVAVVGLSFAMQRLLEGHPQVAPESRQTPLSSSYRVTVKGMVVPARVARLSFTGGGQVAEVAVTVGDQVTIGQVLAKQNTQALDLQAQMAAIELQLQQARLEQLVGGVSAAELAAAQAIYDAATAAYATLIAGPRPEEVAIATAGLKRAEVALQRAQADYDAVSNLPDIGARPESMGLQSATIDYQQTKAAYDLATAGPNQSQLKEAEGRVASARAQLEKLRGQAPLREMQIAQANVARAQAALAAAQLAVQQATLTAPITGTVTSIEIHAPEMASPGSSVLTIASLDHLQIELTDLDEWALTRVQLGQTVNVTVPGLANRSLQGRLASISSEPATQAAGGTFYKSIITLDEQSPGLRWGMIVEMPVKVSTD